MDRFMIKFLVTYVKNCSIPEEWKDMFKKCMEKTNSSSVHYAKKHSETNLLLILILEMYIRQKEQLIGECWNEIDAYNFIQIKWINQMNIVFNMMIWENVKQALFQENVGANFARNGWQISIGILEMCTEAL